MSSNIKAAQHPVEAVPDKSNLSSEVINGFAKQSVGLCRLFLGTDLSLNPCLILVISNKMASNNEVALLKELMGGGRKGAVLLIMRKIV